MTTPRFNRDRTAAWSPSSSVVTNSLSDEDIYLNPNLISYFICSYVKHSRRVRGKSSRPHSKDNSLSNSSSFGASNQLVFRQNGDGVAHSGASSSVNTSTSSSSYSVSHHNQPDLDFPVLLQPILENHVTLSTSTQHSMSPSPVSTSPPRTLNSSSISFSIICDRRTAEVETVLLALCDEFVQKLHSSHKDFVKRLDTSPERLQDFLYCALNILFENNQINWGRLIAVFVLTNEICMKCEDEGHFGLATHVQQWASEFIRDRLWDWVAQNRGWFGLVQFGLQDNTPSSPSNFNNWNPMRALLTVAAGSIGIALVASLFRR